MVWATEFVCVTRNRRDAASYARTSTDQQASCGVQLSECRRVIEQRGYRERFRLKDEAEKGADPNRRGYRRVMELVEDERIDALIVWKLDRAFRSLKEASIAQELLAQHHVALISCTEPFDSSTPIGKVVMGFLVNMAQFETELIKERALLGHQRRAMEGKWSGPRPPFGYAIDAGGHLRVTSEEAGLVRTLHRTYARLAGDRAVAAWMNAHGRLRRGKPWTTDQVRKTLTNPTTFGNLSCRGATHFHADLAIVTRRVFDNTQQRRSVLRYMGRHQRQTEQAAALDVILDTYLQGLADVGIELSDAPAL